MDTIGVRLREERLRNGWSQRDLARESKINVDTISGIETGQHEPRPSTLTKLAGALSIEVRDLFEESALAGKAEAPEAGPQLGEERLPRSVQEQLRDDPGAAVDLMESWASEGRNTGLSNKNERSLVWTLIQLDTELQAAGESQGERLEYIGERLGEEGSPTLRRWLETRREMLEQGTYAPLDEATTQFAQRRIAERMKRALATA